MPLDVSTFVRPVGRLDPNWFTPNDLTVRLAALTSAAEAAHPTSEAAQREFVYAEALEDLHRQLLAEPASVTDAGGSSSYTQGQIDQVALLAQQARRRLARIVASEAGVIPFVGVVR